MPWLVSLYPAAFAAGYVLMSFANTPTPISGLWRPLIVAVVLAATSSVLLGLALRNRALGALVASILVLLMAAPWLALVIGSMLVLWTVGLGVLRRRRGTALTTGMSAVAGKLPVFATMFALVTVATAVSPALTSVSVGAPAPARAATGDSPNIYVLVLDGYPRADVLAASFGIDISGFEAGLESLGFEVPADARSNYTATWASLTSLFHGRYLDEIPELTPFPTDQAEQYFALMRALNRAPLLDGFRNAGYRVITVPSPFENASIFSADDVRSTGQMTSFELSLIQHSPLIRAVVALAPEFLVEQQRQRVIASLDELEAIAAEPSAQPAFAFVHVLSPHAPMVFDADGRTADLPSCFPDRCSMWQLVDDEQWAGLPAQIEHVNRRVLSALESVVSADPDGVIVVMSDHGALPPGAKRETMLESFLAIRSPGHTGLLGDEPHTVNVLALVAEAYVGIPASPRAYEAWVSVTDHPLSVEPAR